MSVIISVSYSHEDELKIITQHLAPLGLRLKTAPQKGQYKRAYFKGKQVFSNVDLLEQKRYNAEAEMAAVSDIEKQYPIC